MKKKIIKKQGSILIITLFVVFFLSSIALSISHAMRTNTKLISRHLQNQKSLNIAKSAVSIAIAELQADKTENNYDCLQDRWYKKFHNQDKMRIFSFKNNEGVFIGEYSINIVDEYSRMNINNVSSDIIANVVNKTSKKNNAKIIQAIIDYRKSLSEKQIIRSVYELLKIKSMDKYIFWAEDTNDNYILDKWENDGDDSLPHDNGNGVLDLGIKDFFTVYTNGKINLNTVSEKILLSIPGMSQEAAKSIISFREKQPLKDEKDFEALSLLSKQTKKFIMVWGAFRSDTFRIIIRARANGAKNHKQIIAIADRSDEQVKIIYWREN